MIKIISQNVRIYNTICISSRKRPLKAHAVRQSLKLNLDCNVIRVIYPHKIAARILGQKVLCFSIIYISKTNVIFSS